MPKNAVEQIAAATSPRVSRPTCNTAQDALAWAFSKDEDPLSFNGCCETVGITLERARAKVQALADAMTKSAAARAADTFEVRCSGCDATIPAGRPAWVWGESPVTFLCTCCKADAPVPWSALRPATKTERGGIPDDQGADGAAPDLRAVRDAMREPVPVDGEGRGLNRNGLPDSIKAAAPVKAKGRTVSI